MVINVYNSGTGVSIEERIGHIIVKDWRYHRHEDGVEHCNVLNIHGENAKIEWLLTMTGMTCAEIGFDAVVNTVVLNDETKLKIHHGGRIVSHINAYGKSTVVIEKDGHVESVFLDEQATLIIEAFAIPPKSISGKGKVVNRN